VSVLQPYPEYVTTGIDFLDQIPSDWTIRPAVTLARVLTSTVDKKTIEGEVPVRLCNYTDVYYNDIIRDGPAYMAATATPDQIASYAVEAGDVVFTKDSETADDIAIAAYVEATLPGVVYGYHLSTYRPHDIRYGKFLKWLLDSKYAKATFQTRTLGVTRVGLSQNTVRYFRVPTPPPDDAVSIGEYLDRETGEIDAFIADQEELIGLLAERRAAMHSRYFHEAVQVLPSERRGAPFGTAIRERDVRVRTRERELMSVSIHHGLVPWSDLHDTEPIAESFSAYKLVEPGDVVLNRMRAFQGAAGVSTQHGMVSPDYAVFRVSPTCDPQYISELLRSSPMIEAIKLRLRGIGSEESGAVRTPRVNVSDLIRIKVELPSRADQVHLVQRLGDEVSESDAVIANAQEAIALSRERRAALISAAVTGKIDVRERR
jgi:type I restriction enzyme S subunit